LRIVIDANVGGDQITGSARHEVGEPKRFMGWLGLIAALDGLLDPSTIHAEEPAVRVCVAFATAQQAEAFSASTRLREAFLESGAQGAPEIWFTRTQPEREGSHV
jgi:hypothetical protein